MMFSLKNRNAFKSEFAYREVNSIYRETEKKSKLHFPPTTENVTRKKKNCTQQEDMQYL